MIGVDSAVDMYSAVCTQRWRSDEKSWILVLGVEAGMAVRRARARDSAVVWPEVVREES